MVTGALASDIDAVNVSKRLTPTQLARQDRVLWQSREG